MRFDEADVKLPGSVLFPVTSTRHGIALLPKLAVPLHATVARIVLLHHTISSSIANTTNAAFFGVANTKPSFHSTTQNSFLDFLLLSMVQLDPRHLCSAHAKPQLASSHHSSSLISFLQHLPVSIQLSLPIVLKGQTVNESVLFGITGWVTATRVSEWIYPGPNQKQLLIGLISIELQNKLVLSFINVSS